MNDTNNLFQYCSDPDAEDAANMQSRRATNRDAAVNLVNGSTFILTVAILLSRAITLAALLGRGVQVLKPLAGSGGGGRSHLGTCLKSST